MYTFRWENLYLGVHAGTDLRIGHGLGPRAFGGHAQLFLWRLNVS